MVHIIYLLVSYIFLVNSSSAFIDKLFRKPELHRDKPDPINLRTVGGFEVDISDVPYQVGLYLTIKHSPFTFGTCGGSLISHQHILTAAHCCERENKLVEKIVVVLGSNHLGMGGLRRTVEVIFVNPEYDELSLKHDIAIVMIQLVVFNNRIRPVSLPTDSTEKYVGSEAIMSGYGKISDQDRINDKRLRAVNLKIISNAQCKRLLDDPFDLIQISEDNICSSASKKGSCDGDSGGPLVVIEGYRRVLIGLTSFGSDTCDSKLPSVFVRVNSYLDWIDNITTTTDFRNITRKKYVSDKKD